MHPPTARHPAERLTRLNQIRRMTSKVRNDTNLPWYNQKGRRSQKPLSNARLDLDRNECVVDSARASIHIHKTIEVRHKKRTS